MKKYFILAAAAAMFAACSNNEDIAQTETPTERIPLMIGAATGDLTVNSTMRGNHTTLQNDTLSKDVKVGLYIFKSGQTSTTSGENYEKVNEQMGGTTTTTGKLDITPVSGTTTLVYPDKKDQGIDLYAYAPYASTGAPTDLSSGTLSVTTQANQTSNENYYKSDILWGSVGTSIVNTSTILSSQPSRNTISAEKYKDDLTSAQGGYDGTTGKILLPLYHAGSKIIINLIPDGMDIAKLRGATVKFYTNYDTGALNITTGAISNLTKSSGTDPIAITLTNANLGKKDDGTDITAYIDEKSGDYSTDASTLHGYSCAAVILPQDVNWDGSVVQSATYKLIEITMPGTGTATTYAYTVNTKQTYEPLKVYTYNIKVKASGLTVTTQVTNWESTTAIEENAVLQ